MGPIKEFETPHNFSIGSGVEPDEATVPSTHSNHTLCPLRQRIRAGCGRSQKAVNLNMSIAKSGRLVLPSLSFLSLAALLIAGCGSGSMTSTTTNQQTETGSSFVVGTDAPMASVVSFTVQVSSIEAFPTNDCSGDGGVQLVSGSPSVDFARFNGLQTLLDMNDVTAGTYNCVTITLGTATLGYLDTTGGGAPTIQTETATLTTNSTNYPLANPMVVAQTGAPVGLHLDFDLRKSIEVSGAANYRQRHSDLQCKSGEQLRSGSLHRRVRHRGAHH